MRMRAIAGYVRSMVAVRLLLLLAFSSSHPVQLVLCLSEGQQPRVENALNGQCLPGPVPACTDCPAQNETEAALLQGSLDGAAFSEAHSHCTDCSDQLLGLKHGLRSNDEAQLSSSSSSTPGIQTMATLPAWFSRTARISDKTYIGQSTHCSHAIIHSRTTILRI